MITWTMLLVLAAIAQGQAADVLRKAKAAVVTVRTNSSSGTGFITGDGTYLVTAYHVVAGGTTISVDAPGVEIAGVHRFDVIRDICVYRLKKPGAVRLQLTSSLPATGSRIYVVGTPLGFLEHTISEGIISGVRTDGSRRLVQISAPISPGSSGGPVLNAAGRVIAMVIGTIKEGQSLNFAVAASEIEACLAARPTTGEKVAVAGRTITDRLASIRRESPPYKPMEDDELAAYIWEYSRSKYPEVSSHALSRARLLASRLDDPEAKRKLALMGNLAAQELGQVLNGNPHSIAAIVTLPKVRRTSALNIIKAVIEKGAVNAQVAALRGVAGTDPFPSLMFDSASYTGASHKLALLHVKISGWKIDDHAALIKRAAELRGNTPPPEAVLEATRDYLVQLANYAPSRNATNALLSLLNDKSSEVRSFAASRLGTSKDGRTVKSLENRVKNDPDEVVRVYAACALAQLGKYSGFEALIAGAKSSNRNVLQVVVQGLGRTAGPESTRLLETLLLDTDEATRGLAAVWLGLRGDPSSLDPLTAALRFEEFRLERWDRLMGSRERIRDVQLAITAAIEKLTVGMTTHPKPCAKFAGGPLPQLRARAIQLLPAIHVPYVFAI